LTLGSHDYLLWIIFSLLIGIALAFDAGIIHSLCGGMGYNKTLEFISVYAIEKGLSVDNMYFYSYSLHLLYLVQQRFQAVDSV
jgi:predicted tellurium resistance membrane protein TerC